MPIQTRDGDVTPLTQHHMETQYRHFGILHPKCSQCEERYPESEMFYCACKKWCCNSHAIPVESDDTPQVCPDCSVKCYTCESDIPVTEAIEVPWGEGKRPYCSACKDIACVVAEDAMEGMGHAA